MRADHVAARAAASTPFSTSLADAGARPAPHPVAAARNDRGAPPVDPARPAPGDRIDGVVGNAAPFIEVASNAAVLQRTMETQKYVIDLLA